MSDIEKNKIKDEPFYNSDYTNITWYPFDNGEHKLGHKPVRAIRNC